MLLLINSAAFAQQNNDSIKIKTLEEVRVKGIRQSRVSDYLKEVSGSGIYAGKKTEIINLQKIDANKATNQSRQIFNRVPGVHVWESDASGIQLGIAVRGLNPNRTSEFNSRQNGYDISADALGYPESYYTPQSDGLEQIEVVRGAASLQYGSQFGGLLNYIMKRPPAKRFELTARNTYGSYGLFNSFTSVGGTSGNVEYYGFFNHKEGDSWRKNSAFNINSGYGHIAYALNEQFKLTAEYTKMHYTAQQPGGLTDVQYAQDARQSIRQRNWFDADWNIFSLSADYKFSERTKLNLRNFAFKSERGSVGDLSTANKIDTLGNRDVQFDNYLNFGNETRLLHDYNAGNIPSTVLVGFRYYRGDTRRRQGSGTRGYDADFHFLHPDNLEGSDFKFPSTNIALFAENIIRVDSQFRIIPGIRYEHINTASDGYYSKFGTKLQDDKSNGRSFVIAGLGLSYYTSKTTELYANFSQAYRAINFNDLRVVNPSEKVDPNLKDARGYNADIGFRGSIGKILNFDAGAYYLRYNNRIGDIRIVDSIFNIYQYRTNVADARSIGVETYAEIDVWQWLHPDSKLSASAFISFAYTDARYLETKVSGIKKGNKVELAPPVIFRTGINVRHSLFSTSLQYSYTGQQFSDATNAKVSPVGIIGIVPAYAVMDWNNKINYKKFAIEFGVNNLLNEIYFTRRATSYPGPGILTAEPRNFYVAIEIRL
ncbi:MAG: TonB-dependent receptor [Chitinophagaceae bacterium]|nr:TonB-dependent receptor [Chitinophagaceae bacterium]